MEKILERLEQQIYLIISQHDELKLANQSLNTESNSWSSEKEIILAKHYLAVSKIQSIITHLKSLGVSHER